MQPRPAEGRLRDGRWVLSLSLYASVMQQSRSIANQQTGISCWNSISACRAAVVFPADAEPEAAHETGHEPRMHRRAGRVGSGHTGERRAETAGLLAQVVTKQVAS